MTHQVSLVVLNVVHARICAELHREVFEEPEQWGEAAFQDLLVTPGVVGWLITESDAPAGLLLVRHCLDEAEILTIAVLPTCRRKGFARLMMQNGMSSLAARGVRSLFLEVSVKNRAAIALYNAQGFVECGVRRAYYSDRSDALVMRHDLHNEMR